MEAACLAESSRWRAVSAARSRGNSSAAGAKGLVASNQRSANGSEVEGSGSRHTSVSSLSR